MSLPKGKGGYSAPSKPPEAPSDLQSSVSPGASGLPGSEPLAPSGEPRATQDAAALEEDDEEGSDDDGSEWSDSDMDCDCEDPEEQEKCHFLDVCWSLLRYKEDVMHDIAQMQEALQSLDAEDAALWQMDPAKWTHDMTARMKVNGDFLAFLPNSEVCAGYLGENGERIVSTVPDGHRVASRNSSKVRSTLRQFVRDWAREGEAERAASYEPLIDAVQRHLPASSHRGLGPSGQPAVLCPGCGLGRLPFDLARLGYAAQGNEFSYHMLLGSHLILNRCMRAQAFTIYPFLSCTTNRLGSRDHLRAVKVPDRCPREELPPTSALSMSAGEFVEVYKHQIGEWDAVASCFFLDTAKNIFLYIRTIAQIIREGGFWINLGPLLYHYADVEHEISIELSWEEVKHNMSRYFDIIEERETVSQYTTNPGSLMAVKYNCVFFVAVRNSRPPEGTSKPVF